MSHRASPRSSLRSPLGPIASLWAVVFVLGATSAAAQVGINTSTPDQVLDVNGKLEIGDDAQAPTPGTIRFNAATEDFEGWTGSRWVSFTRTDAITVETFRSTSSIFTNVRSADFDLPAQVVIQEAGEYLVLFSATIQGLVENLTSAGSDTSWSLNLIRDRSGSIFLGDGKVVFADTIQTPGGASRYSWSEDDHVDVRTRIDLLPGDVLGLRSRVNTNGLPPALTGNYFVNGARIDAIRIGP